MPDGSANVNSRLLWALKLAGLGFKIFPLRIGAKEPVAGVGWMTVATTDDVLIRAWFESVPDMNYGVWPGDAFVVIDMDVKDGRHGNLTLDELQGAVDIDDWITGNTFTVSTPSGGMHYYLKAPFPCSNAHRLGAGIDVRGAGGYVAGPGCALQNGVYTVRHDAEMMATPEWVADRLKHHRNKDDPEKPVAAEVELDLPEAIERGVEWIKRRAPATEGSGGDFHTKMTATGLCDFGLSEEKIFELMTEPLITRGGRTESWNDSCEPPWDLSELRVKIHNGITYRDRPVGSKATDPDALDSAMGEAMARLDAQLGPEQPQPDIDDKTKDDGPVRWRDLRRQQFDPLRWAWAGLILHGHGNTMSGDGGIGKTTLAEQIAVAVASGGRDLLNHKTMAMPALLVLSEDRSGEVKDKITAICKEMNVTDAEQDALPLDVWERVGMDSRLVSITDEGAMTLLPFYYELVARIRAVSKEFGQSPLVMLDHFMDIAELNENLGPPVNAFGKLVIEAICIATGATIVVLRHPSKRSMDDGSYNSGTRFWRGAFRNSITVRKPGSDQEAKTNERVIETWKSSYGPDQSIDAFLLRGCWSLKVSREEIDLKKRDMELVYDVIEQLRKRDEEVVVGRGGGRKPADIAKMIYKDHAIVITKAAVEDHIQTLKDGYRIHYRKRVNGKNGRAASLEIGSAPDANRGEMMLTAVANFLKVNGLGIKPELGAELSIPLPEALTWLVEHAKAQTAIDAEEAMRKSLPSGEAYHPLTRQISVILLRACAGSDDPILKFRYGRRPLMPDLPETPETPA